MIRIVTLAALVTMTACAEEYDQTPPATVASADRPYLWWDPLPSPPRTVDDSSVAASSPPTDTRNVDARPVQPPATTTHDVHVEGTGNNVQVLQFFGPVNMYLQGPAATAAR